eukprot:ctg_1456.g514
MARNEKKEESRSAKRGERTARACQRMYLCQVYRPRAGPASVRAASRQRRFTTELERRNDLSSEFPAANASVVRTVQQTSDAWCCYRPRTPSSVDGVGAADVR